MDPLKTNSDISQKIRKNTKLTIHPIHSCVRDKNPIVRVILLRNLSVVVDNGSPTDPLKTNSDISQKIRKNTKLN